MSSVDLEAIKAEVSAIGDRIRDLKAGGADKAEIGKAVEELNAAKKKYAENNNGIGVDGKPYEPPMSKAEKKKKEKSDATGSAAEADGQPLQVRLFDTHSVVFLRCTRMDSIVSHI